MRRTIQATLQNVALVLALGLGLAAPVHAVDGVIEINQAKALAGGVTPSDTPGFPVTIDTAGSYVLTSNLTVSDSTRTAIELTTNHVTIDLNGFALIGPFFCTGSDGSTLSCPSSSGDGISFPSEVAPSRVTVRNGLIQGFGGRGVILGNESRVEGITAFENGATGIDANFGAVVSNCIARRNGLHGINVTFAALVVDNQSSGNKFDGIQARKGTTVRDNTVTRNGVDGIEVEAGSSVTANSVHLNEEDQIEADNAQVTQNSVVTSLISSGWGLNLNPNSGYAHNTIITSGTALGTVTGGVNQGGNACNGSTVCP